MRAEALAELCAVMRGVPGGTPGTPGTQNAVPAQKCPSFHAFRVFQVEHDENQKTQFGLGTPAGTLPDAFNVAERAAIAIEDGGVPPAYADAWAAYRRRGYTAAREPLGRASEQASGIIIEGLGPGGGDLRSTSPRSVDELA
jgi:hypothetical protein